MGLVAVVEKHFGFGLVRYFAEEPEGCGEVGGGARLSGWACRDDPTPKQEHEIAASGHRVVDDRGCNRLSRWLVCSWAVARAGRSH